ncbi:MAG: hypothetical protein ACYC5O_21905 [Anaerolineae bacterium]
MTDIALLTSPDPAEGLSAYLAELMVVEGLPRPVLLAADDLAGAALDPLSVGAVIAPHLSLSDGAVAALVHYVRAGGALLALQPCPTLAAALGLERAAAVPERLCCDAWLEFRRPHPLLGPIPAGIDCLQYHGQADAYRGGDGVAATIYWGGTSTDYPAILSGSLGRGRFVVFSYDLALSTMLFHQGLREQSSLGSRPDLSGDGTYTPNDLFLGYLAADMRLIPQADLQLRLLSAALEWLIEPVLPLPRLWYFPQGKPAIALIDGDSDAMCVEEMCLYADTVERAGGRYTLYLMEMQYQDVPAPLMDAYRERGHDFGPHVWLALKPTVDDFARQVQHEAAAFSRRYGFRPTSTRHHCVVWPGWSEPARALAQAGIGMEVNFRAAQYFREGYLTGSGLPTPYVDDDGAVIDTYQQPTLLSDDFLYQNKSFLRPLKSEEIISLTRQMLDDSAERYHTVVQPYFHPVYARTEGQLVPGTYTLPWLQATVAHCRLRGLPMPSVGEWLRFTRARRGVAVDGLRRLGAATFAFDLRPAGDWPSGLTVMLPATWDGATIDAVTQAGERLSHAIESRQGRQYALFEPQPALGSEVRVHYRRP